VFRNSYTCLSRRTPETSGKRLREKRKRARAWSSFPEERNSDDRASEEGSDARDQRGIVAGSLARGKNPAREKQRGRRSEGGGRTGKERPRTSCVSHVAPSYSRVIVIVGGAWCFPREWNKCVRVVRELLRGCQRSASSPSPHRRAISPSCQQHRTALAAVAAARFYARSEPPCQPRDGHINPPPPSPPPPPPSSSPVYHASWCASRSLVTGESLSGECFSRGSLPLPAAVRGAVRVRACVCVARSRVPGLPRSHRFSRVFSSAPPLQPLVAGWRRVYVVRAARYLCVVRRAA